MTAVLRVAQYQGTLYRQFWRGSVVGMIVSPVLYLCAMGLGVGSLVDDNLAGGRASAIDGLSYLDYVGPGLMAASAMQASVRASLYPVLGSVKWLRTAFGVAATPVRPEDMALGLQTWIGLQILGSTTIFAIIIAIAGAVTSPLAVLAPLAAALGGLAYSGLSAAWAVGREDDNSLSVIFRVGVLPSFLLSGTFFPISQLPAILQFLATVTPLWHSVELVRSLTTGNVEAAATIGHLAVLAAYTSLGLVLARQQYKRRLYQ